MKTLALFSALLLLAFQAQAEPLSETTEEAEDHQQPEEEDQEVAISFAGHEGDFALQNAGLRSRLVCFCRRSSCGFLERRYGTCKAGNKLYLFCCR